MQPAGTILHRYFAGLAEYVFHTQLGVVDVQLVEYVADLLIRFVHVDTLHKVRNLSGRPMTEVTEMLVEANQRVGEARRKVHCHIGDFTLFWAGVYPEALRELCSERKRDHFIDYCAQGKMAYFIASTIEASGDVSPAPEVLERLSNKFEMWAYGLREVRREWERRDGDDIFQPVFLD